MPGTQIIMTEHPCAYHWALQPASRRVMWVLWFQLCASHMKSFLPVRNVYGVLNLPSCGALTGRCERSKECSCWSNFSSTSSSVTTLWSRWVLMSSIYLASLLWEPSGVGASPLCAFSSCPRTCTINTGWIRRWVAHDGMADDGKVRMASLWALTSCCLEQLPVLPLS